jgi:hypothetical protein
MCWNHFTNSYMWSWVEVTNSNVSSKVEQILTGLTWHDPIHSPFNLVSFPLRRHCLGTVISSPPPILESHQIDSKKMASTECFGIVIRNESQIAQAICRKKTQPTELVNKIDKQAKRYCLLQNCYESYMTFCLVYEEVQKILIKKNWMWCGYKSNTLECGNLCSRSLVYWKQREV